MAKALMIALDGPAGSGKSTIASQVAQQLGFIPLNSGLLYRALAKWMEQHAPATDCSTYSTLLDQFGLIFRYLPSSTSPEVWLEGRNVIDELKDHHLGSKASAISADPQVREWVNQYLRQLVAELNAKGKYCIMEGRDVGSEIFPNALLKIFLTATPQSRAQRRWLELKQSQSPSELLELEKIARDLAQRDLADSERPIAPLRQMPDALLLDSSSLTLEEVKDWVILQIRQCIKINKNQIE